MSQDTPRVFLPTSARITIVMTEHTHHDHAAAGAVSPEGKDESCHCGHHDHDAGDGHVARAQDGAAAAPLVKDPVCGMTVDPHTSKHHTEYRGRTYYFCSARCRERFEAEPEKYVASEPVTAKAEKAPEGTIYTCPMHPEIRQVGPGSCPICGMALEPVLATSEAGPNPELVDMTRRFWVGLALSVPVVALEM